MNTEKPSASSAKGEGQALSPSERTASGETFDPWREMEAMQQQMQALFGRVFGLPFGGISPRSVFPSRSSESADDAGQGFTPEMDVWESDGEYTIHAALPGVDPQTLRVEASPTGLTLRAEPRPMAETNGATPHTHHRRSRYHGLTRWQFVLTLPQEIATEEVRAVFRHGMLELHLPKQQAHPRTAISIPVHIEPVHVERDSALPTAETQADPAAFSSEQESVPPSPGSSNTPEPASPAASSPLSRQERISQGKLGMEYRPTGGEDHAAMQNTGARLDAALPPPGYPSAPAAGSTNTQMPPPESLERPMAASHTTRSLPDMNETSTGISDVPSAATVPGQPDDKPVENASGG